MSESACEGRLKYAQALPLSRLQPWLKAVGRCWGPAADFSKPCFLPAPRDHAGRGARNLRSSHVL